MVASESYKLACIIPETYNFIENKTSTRHRYFPINFAKFLRATFRIENLRATATVKMLV